MSMKRLIAAAFAFVLLLNACAPEDEMVSEVRSTPEIIDVPNDYQVPNPRIALEVFNKKVQASPDGVSVNVTSLGKDYVKFSTRPGSSIKSYAINVIPLSLLYNHILENDGVDASAIQVEDIVLKSVFGGAFSGTALNESLLGNDWKKCDFDWVNTEYAQYEILPATQYVIITIGCYESAASIDCSAELNIVYFETPSEPSLNPDLTLRYTVGYTAYSVLHQPNENTETFTYYSNEKSMIDEYADLFGDRMLRDFVRTAMGTLDAKDETLLGVSQSFGAGVKLDPDFVITHLAVAMDRNGTPSDLKRVDFSMKQVPEDAPAGVVDVSVKEDACSALYAEYEIYMCKNTNAAFYRTLTAEEAEQWQETDSLGRVELAFSIYNEGYAVSNPKCDLNSEENSESYMSIMNNFLPSDDKDYVIAYLSRNRFMQLSDVKFTPFRSKKLVTDKPELNESDLKLEFLDVTKSSFTYSFTYNPDKTANFYFILIDPVQQHKDEESGQIVDDYDVPADDAPRQEWMDFFFCEKAQNTELIGGYAAYMNNWERSMSGSDSYTMFGFEMGTYFRYAYVAVDMNGVVGDIKFAEVTTLHPQAGPDPQMSMDCVYDPASRQWTITFTPTKDCDDFHKYVGDEATLYIDRLGPDKMRAYEFYDHWDNWIYISGLLVAGCDGNYVETASADKDQLALCVPLGVDAGGKEVVGKMSYAILTKDGEIKHISDYYPNYTEK